MYNANSIVRQLKSFLKKQGISQANLARRISVNEPVLALWLKDSSTFDPTLKQLINTASLLDISLVELLALVDISFPEVPQKTSERAEKTTTGRPAAKTSAKAAAAESSKVQSTAARKKTSVQTARPPRTAVAAAADSKDTKISRRAAKTSRTAAAEGPKIRSSAAGEKTAKRAISGSAAVAVAEPAKKNVRRSLERVKPKVSAGTTAAPAAPAREKRGQPRKKARRR